MNKEFAASILLEIHKRFLQYKSLGDKTFEQLEESDFHFRPNASTNSIAIIIQHMHGNMISRFTDFLTTDGEKEWRNRDTEFQEQKLGKTAIIELWEEGWITLLNTLASLQTQDLEKKVLIRQESLSVTDALFRQLAHYAYHVGQIVHIGKTIKADQFQSLSIPIGQSQVYNQSEGVKDPANLNLPKKEL